MLDFEGIIGREELMSQGTDCPRVNFLVVLHSHKYLRGKVERSTADGRPEFLGTVHRPAEIAYFSHSLNKPRSTWQSTMFYNLISL